MTVTCPTCKGGKKMMALGMLVKDCLTCGGLGYIVEKEEIKPEIEKIVQKSIPNSMNNQNKTKGKK